jgi:hypothetical protein
MIDTKKSELYNKATRTMVGAMMVLLLHRLLTDGVIFCAFEKMSELMTANKRLLEH